ncbi:unnamed protein product [Rotaria socialis]|uniref:Uncharacterized protein n=2 Tax=Rotaria socialis TaxID=392032 RepID=A0A821PFB4_9BILA|nr:unnamed protein product [Rotaria socialis]
MSTTTETSSTTSTATTTTETSSTTSTATATTETSSTTSTITTMGVFSSSSTTASSGSTLTTTSGTTAMLTMTTFLSTTSTTTASVPECIATFSANNTNLFFACPSSSNLSILPISGYNLPMLTRVTSLSVQGYNGSRGPLVQLPSNICFFTNLRILNVSFNRINLVDSELIYSNPSCLNNLRVLDLSSNYLQDYPSLLLRSTQIIEEVFLQNNQITSFDLGSIIIVSISINLSNNEISKITNNANINVSTYTSSFSASVDLTNNSEIIDVTDSIYEMYGACYEIQQIFNTSLPQIVSILTMSFLNINFARSKINCTCDQYYIQQSFLYSFNMSLSSTYALSNTMCTDQTLFYNNSNIAACNRSSVNFATTMPRLCILNSNNGNISLVNVADNITQTYPYYLPQIVNNSYCLFTFYSGGNRMSIDCVNESSTLTAISSFALNSIYFQNITQVSINNQNSVSELPAYLCSLPSNTIDLSNQSFSILNSTTFPCSSNNTVQNINLAYNQVNVVNLTLSNWISIDLTSNNLAQFPYSLFDSNESTISSTLLSPRTLSVSSNQLTEFDLFVYTYADTNTNLQNNPFSTTLDGYTIINNYQKRSLVIGSLSANVMLPNQMRFLLNDQVAQDYNTCTSNSLNYLIAIFEQIKSSNSSAVDIECDCSSIYIKEYFNSLNSSDKITNRFQCSNTSSLTIIQFENLTETNCLSNITLSPNRLCQFARLATSTVSNSNASGQSLSIILGSVLGSLGFLLLLAIIIGACYYIRKSSIKNARIVSYPNNSRYTDNNRLDAHIQTRNVRWPQNFALLDLMPVPPPPPRTPRPENTRNSKYFLPTKQSRRSAARNSPSYYTASVDLSQLDSIRHQRRRQRPNDPPIDHDAN